MNTSLFEALDKNTKGIHSLLKDLGRVMEDISSAMHSKHVSRQRMTEEQIKGFAMFRQFIDTETTALHKELSFLSALKKKAMSDLVQDDTDISLVYNRLSGISARQNKTIESINEILAKAGDTLELIS